MVWFGLVCLFVLGVFPSVDVIFTHQLLRSAYGGIKYTRIKLLYSCCAAWFLPGSIWSTTPTAYYILRRASHADETVRQREEREGRAGVL
jgi:hypothetical protein